MTLVVDSWAMMAWLQAEEPAASEVERLVAKGRRGQCELAMSAINAGEVYYLLARRGGRDLAEQFRRTLPFLPIRLVVPDAADIWQAALVKSETPIAYGDAFAVVLARQLSSAVLTGDPEFGSVTGLKIRWLRRDR